MVHLCLAVLIGLMIPQLCVPLQCSEKHDRQLSRSYDIMQEKREGESCMKMERLIGILSILLQREKVTAPELAEQF